MELRWTRRSALLGAFALGGCALINQENPTTRPTPTQIPSEQAESAAIEAGLAQTYAMVSARAVELGAQDNLAWLESAQRTHQAHQDQLLLPSPGTGSTTPFKLELPTTPPLDPNLNWDSLINQLNTLQGQAQGIHLRNALQVLTTDESMALLYASMAASCTGPVGPPPLRQDQDGPRPRPITRPTAQVAATELLDAVRTLILVLETGSGRLQAQDPVRTRALARLDEMKQLRDDLLSSPELSTPPDRTGLSYHRTAMDTPEQVQQVWISGELALVTGWAHRFIANSDEAAKLALQAFIAQAAQVRSLGGSLPQWPGW